MSILGFGCMRLPTKNGNIDEQRSIELIRSAAQAGVNYFDTAYIYYHGGKAGRTSWQGTCGRPSRAG